MIFLVIEIEPIHLGRQMGRVAIEKLVGGGVYGFDWGDDRFRVIIVERGVAVQSPDVINKRRVFDKRIATTLSHRDSIVAFAFTGVNGVVQGRCEKVLDVVGLENREAIVKANVVGFSMPTVARIACDHPKNRSGEIPLHSFGWIVGVDLIALGYGVVANTPHAIEISGLKE